MSERPIRVLIEHENPRRRQRQAADLEAVGFEVETCGGPASLPGRVCPLVTCGRCGAAANAHVIVNQLPLGQIGIYAVQRAWLADAPVVLGLSEADTTRYPALTQLPRVIPRNALGSELVDAVRQAAAECRDSGSVGP